MNKIVIDGDISYWGFSSRWLSHKLKDLSGELEVYISSYGGDVFEGIDMFNQFRMYSKEKGKVHFVIGAKAMSIASLIPLSGDTRKAHANSTIMIHKSWTWLAGNSDDLLQEAKILDSIDNIMVNEYDKYMKEDKDSIKDILGKEGWYIGKDEIEPTGFIDEFIDSDDEIVALALSQKAFSSSMDKFSAKAKEEGIKPNFDAVKASILSCNDGKCPLVATKVVSAPTASDGDKSEKNSKGANMTEKEIQAMQEQNKVLSANRDTLVARNQTLELQAKSLTADLDEKSAEVVALNASIETKISEATEGAVTSAKAEVETRVAEAFNTGVANKDTIVAMINATDADSASKVAIDAKQSDGSTPQSAGMADKNAWSGHFNNK